jgi:hypothetical protein
MATQRKQSGRALLVWTLFGVALLCACVPLLQLCLAPSAAEVVEAPGPAAPKSEPAPVERVSVPDPLPSRKKDEPPMLGQRFVEAPPPLLILPLEVEFLGNRASGNRFCIVADSSSSMRGAKLDKVKEEMVKTLNSLKEGSRFFVIFFNTKAVPMPQGTWLPGGKASVDLVEPWIRARSPKGGTNPDLALQLAFQLSPRPDVIFLMTDGQMSKAVGDKVQKLNTTEPRVRVNTILFGGTGKGPAAAQLQRIAADSGGSFSAYRAK